MRIQGKQRRRLGAGTVGVLGVAAIAVVGVLAAAKAPAAATTPAHQSSAPTLTTQPFGQPVLNNYTGKDEQTYRYILNNGHGLKVNLLSFGAITQAIYENGTDVVLGFNTLQDYISEDSPPVTANGGPYFGETVGRYANRIADGTFQLNGQTYHIAINNGVNTLHGGLYGFGDQIWHEVSTVSNRNEAAVTLQLVSPANDGAAPQSSPGCGNWTGGCTGYPGQLTVDVTYSVNTAGQYEIHYSAHNDSSSLQTVVNLTNHSYFNLAGEASAAGSAYSQDVEINANNYSPTDTTQIPLPNLPNGVSVKGTPFDFTSPQAIGSRINDITANDNVPASDASLTNGESQLQIAQGYDHNWILNPKTARTTGPAGLEFAAAAYDPGSGRTMKVYTDQPGVQFYSGNFLTGTLTGGIDGQTFRQGAGYTFETQHYPNSPNVSSFPTTVVNPGATFSTSTIFAFSVSHGI
jgi:aldose 1-epimerase